LYDKILSLYSRQGLTPHFTVTHVEAHEEAGAIMVASGRAMFIGAGALVTRAVDGIELIAIPLDEAEAKIEVYMAWRKDEESAAVFSFLDSVRRIFAHPMHKETPAIAHDDKFSLPHVQHT
jgi:DNA-binding transcriptional LysR family regulator